MLLPLTIRLLRDGYSYSLRGTGARALGKALASLIPALMVATVQQATPLLDRMAGSLLPVGAISELGYGSKILEMLVRTAPLAIVMAFFPSMSQYGPKEQHPRLFSLSKSALRWILISTLPIALYVLVLRQALVAFIFQRGSFTSLSSVNVAEILGWYSIAFIPASLVYGLTHVFFSMQRFWTIVRIHLAGCLATLGLNIILGLRFGPSGIALSYLIVVSAIAIFLFQRLRAFLPAGSILLDIRWLGKVGLASILYLFVLFLSERLFIQPTQDFVSRAIGLLLIGVLGMTFYCSMMYIAGLSEIRLLVKKALAKISSS
jgi:putative peptidoglycan lipid II flippase